MRVSTFRVVAVLVSVQMGVAAGLLAQEKVQPVQKGPKQEKKLVVTQVAPQADLAGMTGITDGALAGVLENLISWDTGYGDAAEGSDVGGAGDYGGTGDPGGPGGIDEDTWDQSGLGDELGDYDDYGSDQDRQDAIDALAWEQSGAADATGKSWGDFDNDEERAAALEQAGEEQKDDKEDTSSDEQADDGSTESEQADDGSTEDASEQEGEEEESSSGEDIVGKQFPLTQVGDVQVQTHHLTTVQISARTQVRKMLAQMLLDSER
jgi:hypothetical protein